MYNESLAILRLVGRQFGYYPPEPEDAHTADALVDYSNDFIAKFVKLTFFEKKLDEEGQKEYAEFLKTYVTYLQK